MILLCLCEGGGGEGLVIIGINASERIIRQGGSSQRYET